MKITPVYNMTLLGIIYKAKRISYDELLEKRENSCKAVLDNELATLIGMGCIKECDGDYIYVKHP